MDTKRKIPKRIFSFFLAILCTFGILFVSYINIYAVDFPLIPVHSAQGSDAVQYGLQCSSDLYVVSAYSDIYCAFVSTGSSLKLYLLSLVYRSNAVGYAIGNNTYSRVSVPYSVSGFSFYSNNGSILVSYNNPLIPVFSSVDELYSSFDSFLNPTPSPEPTPTPAPATPTPNPYGPGPVPTIPPGEQSYTDFFSRLASDAQSAFNAIFLSWNNANSRFYSGIFFIGFPILLGIIGLVASIFFGDDD